METILVVNAGSSSLKFQVFTLGAVADLKCLIKGQNKGCFRRVSKRWLSVINHKRNAA
jgi:acetate kinase